MSKRDLNLRMFLATVAFAVILLAPLAYSYVIEQDELGFFSAGGLSLQEIGGAESAAAVEGRWTINRDDGVLGSYSNAFIQYACDAPTSGTSAQNAEGTFSNITSGNLTVFGDGYGFALMPDAVCSGDGTILSPATVGTDALSFNFNISYDEMMDTEVIRFIMHLETNQTFRLSSVAFVETDRAPVVPALNYHIHTIVDRATDTEYEAGEIWEIPLTTQDRLQIQTWGDQDKDHDYVISLAFRADPDELADHVGELVIGDIELDKTREGLLTNEGKMVTFNILYILVGGFSVLLATPWFSWDDVTRGSRRLNRKGAQGTSGVIMILVIAGAIGATWIWGGWSSISEAFEIAFLPFTLAAALVALTAFSTRGKTARKMSLVIATGAGILGWTLGMAMQNSWMAYDKLYVAPFVDLVSGNVSATVFPITAAIVVIVQALGLLVMIYNVITTIGTDEVAFVQ